MPELISRENRAIIARELAARDIPPETIQWAVEELDKAARQFVEDLRRRRGKRHSPENLSRQIDKVQTSRGEDRVAAIRQAEKMGLDSEALELLANDQGELNLHQLAHKHGVLERLNPAHFSPLANKAFPEARRFMFKCLAVWIFTVGEVRFSNNAREDGGPLGRFLTAAKMDVYLRENLKVPSAEAFRKNARRVEAAFDAIAFDWHGVFEERDTDNLDLDSIFEVPSE